MDNQKMKIRISLTSREVEFDGDLQLIKDNFGEYIQDYLKVLNKESPGSSVIKQPNVKSTTANSSPSPTDQTSNLIPDSFGEYYSKFPKSLSNVDKLLLASFFLQSRTDGKCFTVKEASDLLLEQGVSLSNAGVFNKHNITSRRVFKLSGKSFRVSDTGLEYIKSLTVNQ
ncbi:MAG TPA: hypothetical protein VFE32_14865 [Puia sp.]|jgi:hypothetical protein|nr:hypothetical protein [Puia sp.]